MLTVKGDVFIRERKKEERHRCYVDDKVSKVAWLNRSNIIYAGQDKWSLDPRVDLVTKGQLEYSLRIQKVDVYDEGSYTCSIQTKQQPKTSQVYLIVQGKWHLHIDTSSTQHTTNPRQPYRFTLGNGVNILYSKQKLEQI
ncbi:limbic system-associated membrane protein-like isoform X1 [Gymnodraco acuticeps]|uniref:Limbic system-associated membrane protein-like isoform X1 n=2 Tax=Notothenioidei TaxID=8205 RepID=A0A6P8T4Z2_GYMAC|nr:limbic system-associated membrane protein-like isoform X1 [Gymnodraco acuticeps]KAJ4935518.1 hypothetical protein JOQ06_017050 [Pogonophryne albipinna]